MNTTLKTKIKMEFLDTTTFWISFLAVLVPLFLLKLAWKLKNKSRLEFPPSPPMLPIVGNFHQLGEPLHRSLWELSKQYGPVMLLRLGNVSTLVISSAEAAKQVLKTHDLDFCTRPPSLGIKRLSYNYLDISFAPYGDYWREIRKVCVLELFSVKRVQSFGTSRAEEVAAMIDSITESSVSNTPIDISAKILSLSEQIIFKVAFGMSHDKREQFANFANIIFEAIDMLSSFAATDYFPRVGWIIDRLTGLHTRLEKSFYDLDTFYQKMIDEHLDTHRLKSGHEDIIDVLLKLERDGLSSVHLTKDHIKAIIMDLFIAGVETSASTLNWAMTELIRNPEPMKKVHEEIRSYVGKRGKVEEADLDHFQYLKMVVKETVRLHTPLPLLLPRECMHHCKIDGYDVLPGTRVFINAFAIGRNPKYWEKPEEFIPERFIDNSMDFKGQTFEFLPFGGGRRACPGINMALATVHLTLANLLYSFNWELPKGMKKEEVNMDESSGLALHKKSALHLVPIRYM